MKVEVICDSDSPNVAEARAQLLRAFAETGIPPRWVEWNRDSAGAPSYVHTFGSPTVLVNGLDVAEQTFASGYPCCRLYPDPSGTLRGTPTVERIVAALKEGLFVRPNQSQLTVAQSNPASEIREHCPDRRHKNDAACLAIGVISTVLFAALVLAVQDHYSKKIDPEKTRQAESSIAKLLPQKYTFPQLGSAMPASVLAIIPTIKHQDVHAEKRPRPSGPQQDSGRAIGLRVPRSKSTARPRIVNAKRRLIALWHQSLVRN